MPFLNVAEQPSKEILPGFISRTVHTGTMTFAYVTVTAGAVIGEHSHMHEQVCQVLKGRFQLTVDGETRTLEPGMVALIKPYSKHGGKALTDCELLDVFLPEREDYKF